MLNVYLYQHIFITPSPNHLFSDWLESGLLCFDALTVTPEVFFLIPLWPALFSPGLGNFSVHSRVGSKRIKRRHQRLETKMKLSWTHTHIVHLQWQALQLLILGLITSTCLLWPAKNKQQNTNLDFVVVHWEMSTHEPPERNSQIKHKPRHASPAPTLWRPHPRHVWITPSQWQQISSQLLIRRVTIGA